MFFYAFINWSYPKRKREEKQGSRIIFENVTVKIYTMNKKLKVYKIKITNLMRLLNRKFIEKLIHYFHVYIYI